MKEYIERAAVEEMLENAQIITDGENCGYCTDDVNLNSIPAADVAEVRHGRWIPEACESVSKRNRLIEYRVYSCSICGRSNGCVKKRYCPNCGARMDKEDEHEAD